MIASDTTPVDERQFDVTVPTTWTIWLRTFVPWQMVRFAVINLRMLRLIWRGHHQPHEARAVTPVAAATAAPDRQGANRS
jgi:hypothetical protein